MGITVHFEGRLRSVNDYKKVVEKGVEFARRVNSGVIDLNSEHKKLERVIGEKELNYEGPVIGIQIQPHESSEPLILEFDKNFYIQEYCKTQFAGVAAHLELLAFLKEIEPHFDNLVVIDEGEFWETNDFDILEDHFERFFEAFENAKEENPKLSGPYRINGRIIDLME
jgi:hypothetical protein